MKLTLNTRVTMFITVVVFVLNLASAGFLFITYRGGVLKEITARGTTMAEALARGVAEGIASENLGIIKQVQSIVRADDVVLAQVYSPVWLPIDSYPDDNFSLGPDPRAQRMLDAEPAGCYLSGRDAIDFYAPVTYHQLERPANRKFVIGYVRLKLSTRQVSAVILWRSVALCAGSLAFTLLAVLVLNGLIRRAVLKPLEQLNQVVSAAVRSDAFLPVPVAGTDEIAELAGNCNRMFSAIRERENSLRESEAGLRKVEKLESLGLLAGGIAHDFNNILTAIIGNISCARSFLDESDRSAALLQSAEKAAFRAGDLAHQLLTFAKGGQPIKQNASIRPILEESASLVLRGASVAAIIELPDDLWPVEIDPGQISQVSNNILINALHAMPDGGTIRIQGANAVLEAGDARLLAPGDYIRITIADTGCGISAENQKRIFDPYFSTRPGGSGLGLASAHSVVTRHGGAIGVRSAPGLGATFEILLPACGRQAPDGEAAAPSAEAPRRSGHSVLVMDDEETIREASAVMLEALGHRVRTCAHGEEAIALYREALAAGDPYSAVIMDLTIPGGMGGRQAAQRLLDLDPGALLIVSSGYSNDPVMAEPDRFGFRGTLMKPYTLAGLARALGAAR